MSTYWRVVCETCGVRGPQFGRTAGGMTFADPQLKEKVGGMTLAAFLVIHDYHDLRLEHE